MSEALTTSSYLLRLRARHLAAGGLPDDARGLFQLSATDRDQQGTILDIACKELTPASRERLVGEALRVSSPCILATLESWTAGGFEARLADIRARTLVVATDDDFLPADFLQQAVVAPIAGARLHHLPGPGHYSPVERPAEVAQLLSDFLSE